jgi:hypothetical protein
VLRRSETVALVSSPRISINKPKVCFFFLVFAFAFSVPLSLAGRGGEEWGGRISGRWEPERSRGLFRPVFSCDTSERPRSGEIEPLGRGWISFVPLAKALYNKHFWLQSSILDVFNIDLAGRGGEEEDEEGVDSVVFCDQVIPSWEAIFWSNISAADGSRPTSKAIPWPIQKPAKDSGESTSFVRPLLRSAAAYYGCLEASGSVPASKHDGGVADLSLGCGEREGSDCVSPSLSEVFSANARDLYVLFDLMGSFVIMCTSAVWI